MYEHMFNETRKREVLLSNARQFKNLMVTGGCGFIGSNLIRYILGRRDFEGRVINVDKLTYAGNPASLSDIEKSFGERYVLKRADICDSEKICGPFSMALK